MNVPIKMQRCHAQCWWNCIWLLWVHRNLFDHIGKNVTDNLCRYTFCATLKTWQRSSSAIPNRSDMNRKLIRMTVFCRLWSKVTLKEQFIYWSWLLVHRNLFDHIGKMLRTMCAATHFVLYITTIIKCDMNRKLIRITIFCRLWSKVTLRNNS